MNYKVGDWVVVRDWDNMADKYGLDHSGDIDTPNCYFVKDMKEFCNNVYKVIGVDEDNYRLDKCNSFCFTDEMVRPFDMEKDLIEGDKLLRIERDNFKYVGIYINTLHKTGEIYTFDSYHDNMLLVKEFPDVTGSIKYFKFVERPKKEETNIKGEDSMKKCSYKCKTKEEQIFLLSGLIALGYKIHGKDNYTGESFTEKFGIEYDIVVYKENKYISGSNLGEGNFSKTLDDFIADVLKKEKFQYYKDKFIPAMKQLVKEYIDDNHKYGSNCVLCKTVREIKNINMGDFLPGKNSCNICPWVVLTGNTCREASNSLKRAEELIDWIKKYNDFED